MKNISTFNIFMLTAISCGGDTTEKTSNTDASDTGASDTGYTEVDNSIELSESDIANLPYDVQDGVRSGDLKAYNAKLTLNINELYPTEVQTAFFTLSAFADGQEDPTEGIVALAADSWCCDIDKYDELDDGSINGSIERWTECDAERAYHKCSSEEEEALGYCYRWGNPDELLDASASLKGYRFNDSVSSSEFPCSAARDNFYVGVSQINETVNYGLSSQNIPAQVSDFRDGLYAFKETMTAPQMSGLILVDSSDYVVFVGIQSFDVPFASTGTEYHYIFADEYLPEPQLTANMGVSTVEIPVGAIGYSVLNDYILPAIGIEQTIPEVLASTAATVLCSPLDSNFVSSAFTSTCEEQVTDGIVEKIKEPLEEEAAKVIVHIGDVQFGYFNGSSATFTAISAIDSSLSVTGSITVQ